MQLEFISAKSTFAVDGGEGETGVLKKQTKTNTGREWSGLSVCLLCEKNCLIIQTENRGFAVLSLSRHYIKVFFLLKKRKIFLFLHSDGELFSRG